MDGEWPRISDARDGRSIQVRHVAYGDAPALHLGELQVAHEAVFLGVEPAGVGDLPAVIERLRANLTDPRAAQLVAELDGQLAGAVTIRPGPYGEKDGHWRRLVLWVIPAGRRVGVGEALLEGALTWARGQNLTKVIADVFGSNAPALALCRKFGFVMEGRQKNLFALPGIGLVDNVLMALDL